MISIKKTRILFPKEVRVGRQRDVRKRYLMSVCVQIINQQMVQNSLPLEMVNLCIVTQIYFRAEIIA